MEKLLKLLCELPGVSGDEGRVADCLAAHLEGHCTLHRDPLGNLIAHRKGQRESDKTILLTAHMDEVGFILTTIDEEGMLRFKPVGGIDPAVVAGKTVYVGPHALPGVVGIKAIHQQSAEERTKALGFDQMAIDIGAASRAQAEEWVRPGDRIVFHGPLVPFGNGLWMGKAIDDRAACALLAHLLTREDLPCTITAAFTVQEETGCVGARTVGAQVQPDISLVLETTTAADIAGVPRDQQVCRLGHGPVVSFMDKGTIYDRELYELALKIGAEKDIPVQVKEMVSGGNESRSLQVAGGGSRVLVVSLPTRYLHSPSCVASSGDLAAMEELVLALLTAVSE